MAPPIRAKMERQSHRSSRRREEADFLPKLKTFNLSLHTRAIFSSIFLRAECSLVCYILTMPEVLLPKLKIFNFQFAICGHE